MAIECGIGSSLIDCDGVYRSWLDARGAVALQRPDFVVFGTAPDAPSVNDLLRSLQQSLSAA